MAFLRKLISSREEPPPEWADMLTGREGSLTFMPHRTSGAGTVVEQPATFVAALEASVAEPKAP